jgi:hypothetical protein
VLQGIGLILGFAVLFVLLAFLYVWKHYGMERIKQAWRDAGKK